MSHVMVFIFFLRKSYIMNAKDFDNQIALEEHEINTFNLNNEDVVRHIQNVNTLSPFVQSYTFFNTGKLPPIFNVNASDLDDYSNMFKYGVVDLDGQIKEVMNHQHFKYQLGISQESVFSEVMSDIKEKLKQKLHDWLDTTKHMFTFMSYTGFQIRSLINEIKQYPDEGKDITIYINATSYYRYGKEMKPITSGKDYLIQLKHNEKILKDLMSILQEFAEKSYPNYIKAIKGLFDSKEEKQEFIDQLLNIASDLTNKAINATEAKQKENNKAYTTYESDVLLGLYFLKAKISDSTYPELEIKKMNKKFSDSKEKIPVTFSKNDLLEILELAYNIADTFTETERIIDRFSSMTLDIVGTMSKINFIGTGIMYLVSRKFRYLYNMLNIYLGTYSRTFMISKSTVEAAYGLCNKVVN